MTVANPLRGRRAALVTLHSKGVLIAPAMREHAGIEVVEIVADTDQFGTFSGEVPRAGGPLDAAKSKALLGIRLSGLSTGVASEGVFGPHPESPFLTCDTEYVMLVDEDLGLAIHEMEVQVGVPALSIDVSPESFGTVNFDASGFPSHGLIVRPTGLKDPVVKGIHGCDELRAAVQRCAPLSADGTATVQSDFRAIHHPTRRDVISRAADRLARRLAQLCPHCSTPGWGVVDVERGAPCAECLFPTRLVKADVFGCVGCDHRVTKERELIGVDARYCQWCNP